jgi:hypothetical protein
MSEVLTYKVSHMTADISCHSYLFGVADIIHHSYLFWVADIVHHSFLFGKVI